MPARTADGADGLFRPAVRELVAYEPGKPVEELERELGLERIVKLASNEGTFGPFPAALEAIGARRRRAQPLSGRRRVPPARGARRAARRALRGGRARRRARTASSTTSRRRCSIRATRSSAAGRPFRATRSTRGRWARCRGSCRCAITATTSRRCSQRSATGRRSSTSACPNNPTGHGEQPRRARSRTSPPCPAHVLTVIDQAYFEYVDRPGLPRRDRGVREAGHNVVVCERSRRSTASPASASATASARRRDHARSARCGARST